MSTEKPNPIRHILLLISVDGHTRSLRQIAASLAEIECYEKPIAWPTDLKDKFYDYAFDKAAQEEWLEHLFSLKLGEPEPIVGLKTISDQQVGRVARAFWRRIYPYRNKYGIELGKDVPTEILAHMATALTFIDEENIKNLQPIDIGEPEPDMFCVGWGPPEKSEHDIAQQVFDLHYDCLTAIVDVQCSKMLKTRKMEVVRGKNGILKSWKWVE